MTAQANKTPAATKDRGTRPQGQDGKRDGKPGARGRKEAAPKAPTRTSVTESVVDRGTVDREGTAVAWTIAKRSTTDLDTHKPVSAVYVLKLGEETVEHKSLGDARAAVGKVIRHPEKTTPTKAEAAAKSTGKGGKK